MNMFMTRSRHNRNAVGVSRSIRNVDDEGLGIVVTQTTRFDPTRIKSRFIYWLERIVDEMAIQAREQIRSAGFDVDENAGSIIAGIARGGRVYYKQQAINTIPFDEMSTKIKSVVARWSSDVAMPKGPTALKTYGMMAVTAVISYALPWVGLSMALYSMFGKKKKKKMAIPWNNIYAQAVVPAQETTVNEEVSRIIEEQQQIQQIRVTTIEKRSQEAAVFKLPEGVVGIKRGALVMALKGQPVEVRK